MEVSLEDGPLSPRSPRHEPFESFPNLSQLHSLQMPESRQDDASQALIPALPSYSALNSPYETPTLLAATPSLRKAAFAAFPRLPAYSFTMDRGDLLQRDPRMYPLASSLSPSPLSMPSSYNSSYFQLGNSSESLQRVSTATWLGRQTPLQKVKS
jgi:hypothetical protein